MATTTPKPVDFNQIIQEARKKRKHEELAKEIFSKKTKGTTTEKLSARNGIRKVSSIQDAKTLRKPGTLAARSVSMGALHNRRIEALNSILSTKDDSDIKISIRGMGSRFTVVGSNFAPETTAADIRAVLEPTERAQLVDCVIVRALPSVVAEIVFRNKDVAEQVARRFDGMTADGYKLRFRLKQDHVSNQTGNKAGTEGQPKELFTKRNGRGSSRRNDTTEHMDVDGDNQMESGGTNGRQKQNFNPPTQPAAMDATVPRGPRAQVEDGRYGFQNGKPVSNRSGGRGGSRGLASRIGSRNNRGGTRS